MENEEMLATEVVETEVVDNVDETEVNEIDLELTDTAEEEVKKEEPAEKLFNQKELNEILEKRLARERKEAERKLSKYEKITNTLKLGMGEEIDDLDELNSRMTNLYKEQGIEIPERVSNEKDEIYLAKAYAKEIIESGTEEMEEEANRIAKIPAEKRTIREKTMFNDICAELVIQESKVTLEKQGIDPSILKEEGFKKFASQFNPNTSLVTIHELYSKTNSKSIEKPKSTGSVKTAPNESVIKEFYTPEEANKLTMKDYDNPKLMKAVELSMTKWVK